MEQAIKDFIGGKRLALVGVSRGGKKFGNMAMKELKERGYRVYPVHPQAQEVDGERCYPNLGALQGQVDGAWLCVQPAQVVEVLADASAAGIKNVWLQQGSETPLALETAKQLGLNVVSGKCLLMYAEPVRSFHRFHRFAMKLIGQL
jgi:hypothetical protein